MNAAVLLLASLTFVSLELYFTRILNLKTWNHVVYIIIPFAILGSGVGANVGLIARPFLERLGHRRVVSGSLLAAALATVASTLALVHLPVRLDYLDTLFVRLDSVLMLGVAYVILMIPFTLLGFLMVFLFQADPARSSRLYFFDLLGAGLGAFSFFLFIGQFGVFRSIALLSLVLAVLAVVVSRRALALLASAAIASLLAFVPEPTDYAVDPAKGWEWVPGYFAPEQYEHALSRWHPMGRTDVYRLLDPELTEQVFLGSGVLPSRANPDEVAYVTAGTFEINLVPPPELAWVSTNFLAGTPIYQLSDAGLRQRGSRLVPFSQPMEAPYLLLRDPRVVVIGAGGGRDLFLARSHGAKSVVAAEINPATYALMSPGGEFFEYSGGIYSADGIRVVNTDGRHLVKTLPPASFDLVVLNGVDTYSGLSTGAYAYAESYLYTKNAIRDYLSLLSDDGMINFNRFFFADLPRENLRLFVNVMEAMQELGFEKPWDHVMIGNDRAWAITLIKRSPFTPAERERVESYFWAHGTQPIYPVEGKPGDHEGAIRYFASFVESLKVGLQDAFIRQYPFDISIVTDDKPFFYKHFKFSTLLDPFESKESPDVGPVMLLTQVVILAQATLFILLFLFVPLRVFRSRGIKELPAGLQRWFPVYFGCLGLGFMFVEIPVMQRFTLLLGSPIHSISVTLVALLISTGTGSLLLPALRRRLRPRPLVVLTTLALVLYVTSLTLAGGLFDHFMDRALPIRAALVAASILPLGVLLGVYFPFGLELVARHHEQTIPWAWGINSGFSVLGGILSIILAQLIGFSAVLGLACSVYLVAAFSMLRMLQAPAPEAS